MSLLSPSSTDEAQSFSTEVTLRKLEVEGLSVEVPSLLADCFEYVLENGLVEGIFRISGSIKRMRDVSSNYASYKTWLETCKPLPHDVSGIIKKFTRDYLQNIGGLFPAPVLASLRSHFSAHVRKNSVLSSESYRSTSTSFSSGLESVSEEVTDPEYVTQQSVAEKLDSLAMLLVTKNSTCKNALFIYYLSVLKCVSAHQEQTRMHNANIAIVFQQYLFETWVVTELQSYQKLLEFLLDHFDSFVAKYRANLSLLGGIEDVEQAPVDNGSMVYSESICTSPLTDYSSHQASPPKFSISGSFDGRRRSSISQKFSTFWDSYSSPVNRSKRFSFMSRGSAKSSSDRLPLGAQDISPNGSQDELANLSKSSSSNEQLAGAPNDDYVNNVEPDTRETSRHGSLCSNSFESLRLVQKDGNGHKFMSFSQDDHLRIPSIPEVAAKRPPASVTSDLTVVNKASVDSLVADNIQPLFPSQSKQKSITRRLSVCGCDGNNTRCLLTPMKQHIPLAYSIFWTSLSVLPNINSLLRLFYLYFPGGCHVSKVFRCFMV
ncbi:hypothetical protein JCM33374_g5543 [Metschnikowia sp. JCM 33374]|nr:hypothetical protein JCM33374_g5543 [Metschnikowia sp. JCM 33374]